MQFCTANGSRPSLCPTKTTNLLFRWLCWKLKLFHLAASFSLDHSGGLFYPVLVDSTWTSCLGQAVSNNFMIFLLREGRRSVSLTAILMLGYELIFLRLEYLPPAPSSGKLNETPIDKKNLVVGTVTWRHGSIDLNGCHISSICQEWYENQIYLHTCEVHHLQREK